MIYFFRGLTVFATLNLINLMLQGNTAGMESVWIGIIIVSTLLSIAKLHRICFENRYFKILFLIGLVVFVVIESLIVVNGYKTTLSAPSDAIIVLGARVKGEEPSLTLKSRLDLAYEYLVEHEETIAVLSGGQGEGEDISEAEAMRRYLVARGINEDRLILENLSTNTDENIRNSFKILDTYSQEIEDVIVITNRFHILRSKLIANNMGRKVEGIGAPTVPFLIPNYYLREFFAVVKQIIINVVT